MMINRPYVGLFVTGTRCERGAVQSKSDDLSSEESSACLGPKQVSCGARETCGMVMYNPTDIVQEVHRTSFASMPGKAKKLAQRAIVLRCS